MTLPDKLTVEELETIEKGDISPLLRISGKNIAKQLLDTIRALEAYRDAWSDKKSEIANLQDEVRFLMHCIELRDHFTASKGLEHELSEYIQSNKDSVPCSTCDKPMEDRGVAAQPGETVTFKGQAITNSVMTVRDAYAPKTTSK